MPSLQRHSTAAYDRPVEKAAVLSAMATVPLEPNQPLIGSLSTATAAAAIDAFRRPGRPRAVTLGQRFTVVAPLWTLVDAESGAPSVDQMSYPAAASRLRDGTTPRERRIARTYAARAAA